MKNSQLVTAYLDFNEHTRRPLFQQMLANPLDEALGDEWESAVDQSQGLWDACLVDGWTKQELCAACERRFGHKADRC